MTTYTVHLPPLSTWQYRDNAHANQPTRECRWVEHVDGKQLVVLVRCTMEHKTPVFVVEEAKITGICPECGGWGTLETLDVAMVDVVVKGENSG